MLPGRLLGSVSLRTETLPWGGGRTQPGTANLCHRDGRKSHPTHTHFWGNLLGMNIVETQQTGLSFHSLHSHKRTPKRLRNPATERAKKSASDVYPPYSPYLPGSSFLLHVSFCIKCTPLRKKRLSHRSANDLVRHKSLFIHFTQKPNSTEICNIITCEIDRQSRFNAWDRALRAGVLEQPWGMGWGERWEGDTCTPMADSCECMAKTTTIL